MDWAWNFGNPVLPQAMIGHLTAQVKLLRNENPGIRLDNAVDLVLTHTARTNIYPNSVTQRPIQFPDENTGFWNKLKTQNQGSRVMPLWTLLRRVLMYAATAPGQIIF